MKYTEKYGVSRASRKYNKSRSYIYFWKSRWNRTVQSLACQSRRPHSHPNQHTAEELKRIRDMRRRNVSIDIPRVKVTALVGESGSGKTTLATALMKLVSFPGEIPNGEIYGVYGRKRMSARKKQARAASPLPIDKLERNALTLSILIVILGLICLPHVEKGGDTWYVLMMVFAINAALLLWIFGRIIARKRRNRQDRVIL